MNAFRPSVNVSSPRLSTASLSTREAARSVEASQNERLGAGTIKQFVAEDVARSG